MQTPFRLIMLGSSELTGRVRQALSQRPGFPGKWPGHARGRHSKAVAKYKVLEGFNPGAGLAGLSAFPGEGIDPAGRCQGCHTLFTGFARAEQPALQGIHHPIPLDCMTRADQAHGHRASIRTSS